VRQTAEAHGGFARVANDPRGGARLEVSFGDGQVIATPAPESSLSG
jgi:hypothetical protein